MTLLLALGGNIGNVKQTFIKAKKELNEAGFSIIQESSLYKTEPIGPDQDWYTNQVIEIEYSNENGGIDPEQLLDTIHTIEHDLGRKRDIKWGPRTIDIDILFMGDLVYESDQLNIPHLELHKRSFVLIPLVEK